MPDMQEDAGNTVLSQVEDGGTALLTTRGLWLLLCERKQSSC